MEWCWSGLFPPINRLMKGNNEPASGNRPPMSEPEALAWVAGWVALSASVGYWNQTRGHSFATGMLLSLILSPLGGAIVVLLTKKKGAGSSRKRKSRR